LLGFSSEYTALMQQLQSVRLQRNGQQTRAFRDRQ